MNMVVTYISETVFIMEYRGHTIEQVIHNGMYTANSKNGYLKSDTIAGIKSLIDETEETA